MIPRKVSKENSDSKKWSENDRRRRRTFCRPSEIEFSRDRTFSYPFWGIHSSSMSPKDLFIPRLNRCLIWWEGACIKSALYSCLHGWWWGLYERGHWISIARANTLLQSYSSLICGGHQKFWLVWKMIDDDKFFVRRNQEFNDLKRNLWCFPDFIIASSHLFAQDRPHYVSLLLLFIVIIVCFPKKGQQI